MYLKFIRKLNFYWGLIGLIFITTICSLLLTLVKNQDYQPVVMDLVVGLAGSGALFFGFYLLRFCFQRSKYPFITCEPDEIDLPIVSKLANYEWIWTILIPIFLASLIPIIWFFSTFFTLETTQQVEIVRICCFVGILIFTITNNLIYILILRKKAYSTTQEFSLQNAN